MARLVLLRLVSARGTVLPFRPRYVENFDGVVHAAFVPNRAVRVDEVVLLDYETGEEVDRSVLVTGRKHCGVFDRVDILWDVYPHDEVYMLLV